MSDADRFAIYQGEETLEDYTWRNYFDWDGIDAAEEVAKANCRRP